ncbi:hypothetical protein [Kribbella qitaiheensis]|uniref:hypothetical protein n=1 Tax=Kribbella qitaiheensis TaxID=1544730 RepID=UPI0031B622C8
MERPEEGAEVIRQKGWGFHGCEVAAFLVVGPERDLVGGVHHAAENRISVED